MKKLLYTLAFAVGMALLLSAFTVPAFAVSSISTGNGTSKVTVEGNLPADASLSAKKITDAATRAEIIDSFVLEADKQNNEIIEVNIQDIWNITLSIQASDVQPEGNIVVTIPVPENMDGVGFDVYHLHTEKDGSFKLTKVAYEQNWMDSTVSLTVDSLSSFIFVKNGEKTMNFPLIIGGAFVVFVCILLIVLMAIACGKKEKSVEEVPSAEETQTKEKNDVSERLKAQRDALLSDVERSVERAEKASESAEQAIKEAKSALEKAKENVSKL